MFAKFSVLSALRVNSFAASHVNASIRCLSSSGRVLELNNISNVKGATKKRKRWGRGPGSNRGKLCGFGHQKSFSTPRAFEGGQTPHYKLFPKIGFHNPNGRLMQIVNLETIQEFVDMGRLTPKPNQMLTMRDLLKVGLISEVEDGVKLLANGNGLKVPLHLEVCQASKQAIEQVEKAGGTVTCVHFNRLALRVLMKPYKFGLLPRRARPPPRIMDYYLDKEKCGYLSPEIQVRNLKLFGQVTSEETCRLEHEAFMEEHRLAVKQKNMEIEAAALDLMHKSGGKKLGWLAEVLKNNNTTTTSTSTSTSN